MWADNETEIDLLGFEVHKDLIKGLVTNDSLLPLTVGVFGDWGGGKSSILRMLRRDLNRKDAHPDIACLYFSGWMFEGYDDAKAALLTSVLLQLGEHRRFGPKIRRRVVPLLKRVELMRALPIALKYGGGTVAALGLGAAATYFGIDPHTAMAGIPLAGALGSAVGARTVATSPDDDITDDEEDEDDQPEDDEGDEGDDVTDDSGSESPPEGTRRKASVDWAKLIAKDKTKDSSGDNRLISGRLHKESDCLRV